MKRIRLLRIRCQYFKGFKSLDLDFGGINSVICGANATGKTSVFDAFLWCLFGKNSEGRTDFSIKTLDSDGKPIPKVMHSVEVTLQVGDQTRTFERQYTELWTKPRGMERQVLTGHKSEFLVDGIKMDTKAEFEARRNEVIEEDLFRLLSDPYRFFNLDEASQRRILLDLAGNITTDSIAEKEPRFSTFLGRDIEEVIRDKKSQISALRNALKGIPLRLETAAKLLPEKRDWKALREKRTELQEELDFANQSVLDERMTAEKARKEIDRIQADITSLEKELALYKATREREAHAEELELRNALDSLAIQQNSQKAKIEDLRHSLSLSRTSLESTEKQLEGLRDEFRSISSQEFTVDQNLLICPTCHRPLDSESAQEKIAELNGNFNEHKAESLKANREKGIATKNRKTEIEDSIRKITEAISSEITALESLELQIKEKNQELSEAQSRPIDFEGDGRVQRTLDKIEALKQEMQNVEGPSDMAEGFVLTAKSLQSQISELDTQIAEQGQYERILKEMAELEESNRTQNAALAEREGELELAEELKRRRDEILRERINAVFHVVSFSFSDSQLNGRESIACIPMINGTPYSDANSASRMNAGLDIINAISSHYNIYAPIFVDNRESYNSLIKTYSQIIALRVTEDKSLRLAPCPEDEEEAEPLVLYS